MKHAVIASLVVFLAAHAYAQKTDRGGSSGGQKGKAPKPVDTSCDMKTVKKVKFDEGCGAYINPDDEKTALDKDGNCVKCNKKPVEHEVCEKTFYRCPKCGATSKKGGECATVSCKKTKLVKQVDFARVGWKCTGNCGKMVYDKTMKCDNRDCSGFDKPFVKACSKSGQEPHQKGW